MKDTVPGAELSGRPGRGASLGTPAHRCPQLMVGPAPHWLPLFGSQRPVTVMGTSKATTWVSSQLSPGDSQPPELGDTAELLREPQNPAESSRPWDPCLSACRGIGVLSWRG